LNGVQVNEEEGKLILRLESNQQVAGVQVVVQDAGIMNLSNEFSQLPGQAMADADDPGQIQLGHHLIDKAIERLGAFQRMCD
jgi:hypothetical protein